MAVQSKTFDATVSSAYGQTIPEIKFQYKADQYENYSDIPTKDLPTEKEILGMVNAAAKASARASETTKVLEAAGYPKPDPNSPEQLRKNLVSNLMKQFGMDETAANAMADNIASSVK